jgi:hypothetical protein
MASEPTWLPMGSAVNPLKNEHAAPSVAHVVPAPVDTVLPVAPPETEVVLPALQELQRQIHGDAPARSEEEVRRVEEEIPPVEIAADTNLPALEEIPSGEISSAEELEPAQRPSMLNDEMDVMGEGLRAKAVDRVAEIADRLTEICVNGGQEIDSKRAFTQDLQGGLAGWRLVVEVQVRMRKVPEQAPI